MEGLDAWESKPRSKGEPDIEHLMWSLEWALEKLRGERTAPSKGATAGTLTRAL